MIFISYRKSDSEDFALQLAEKLRLRFGEDVVYLDRSDIEIGDSWRESIEVNLLKSKIVLQDNLSFGITEFKTYQKGHFKLLMLIRIDMFDT